MIVYFAGAESPNWRKKLTGWGVEYLSINFKHLIPRLPKGKRFRVVDRFPDNAHVMVHFDVPDEMPEYVHLYYEWVTENLDRLDFAVEPTNVSNDVLDSLRVDAGWLPVWTAEQGARALQKLTSTYTGIAVPQSAWSSDRPVTGRVNRATAAGTYVHGLGVSKHKILGECALASVSTGAFMSASKFGETQIWDGSELHRFPADQKDSRARYRSHIARSGLDIEAIEADDRDEVTKLALWSWQQQGEYLSRRRDLPTEVEIGRVITATTTKRQGGEFADPEGAAPDMTPLERGTNLVTLRETVPLPTLGFATIDGPNDVQQSIVQVNAKSARVCDNCQLSEVCPSYVAGNTCAFEIPVKIQTKDQLVAVMNGLLEVQAQRVFLARFREDLEGSVDKSLSEEMDRMFRMITSYRDVVDNSETVKMSMEVKGQAGVLSRIFGSRVGNSARELPGGGYDESDTRHLVGEVMDIEPPDQSPDIDVLSDMIAAPD